MKKETADYSAITTWGVFYLNEDSGPQLILLDAVKERLEFPELRRVALEQYKYWNPETVIIEAKASGLPLTYELRKMGIPVINFTPSKAMINIRGLTQLHLYLRVDAYGRPQTNSLLKR
jgi:phage terminase large subunit-like protein